MAGQNGSIGTKIHGVFILIWVLVSVTLYGMLCFLTAPLNIRLSRLIELGWVRHFFFVAGVKVVVNGKEKLDPSKRYVFIANHQSQLDIPVLMGGMRQHLSFLAKKELFSIPIFGWGIHALGHIWIDRANARNAHKSIQRAISRLKKDHISLVLFPEGTRSNDGTVGRFKQGSFALAQQAGVEVVPVAIKNTAQLLTKHSLMMKSGTVELSVGDPIVVSEAMSKAEISTIVREIIVKECAK